MYSITNLLLPLVSRKSSVWIRAVCSGICVLIVVSSSHASVQAQQPPVPIPPNTCGAQPPPPPPLAGESNVQKAFNFLVQQGLAPHQAAGIVGNLEEESYVNPRIHEGGALTPDTPVPNVGFGIAQWTPVSRQQSLVRFAQARNVPVNELGVQLDFLWWEMTSAPGWRRTIASIRAATTVADAAFAFHRDYERSADTPDMIRERVFAGERILARFGQPPPPPPPTECAPQQPQEQPAPPLPTSQIPDCTIYGIDGRIEVGQLEGNEAILSCARLFDPYGYDIGASGVQPSQWISWWERQGEFKNRTFRPVVDSSSIEMLAIYLAFGVDLRFSTATIDDLPQYFRKIPVADAQPGDLMVRPGHTEIAVDKGGARTFGAHTAQINPTQQVSEAQGGKWTSAYVYIGPGSTRK